MTRSTRIRTRALPLVLALLLALGACSLSSDEKAAADSIAAVIGGEGAADSTQDSAECVAQTWVGEAGTRRLADDGLLGGDGEASVQTVRSVLDGEQPVSRRVAAAYADSWLACADYDAIALDEEEQLPDASGEDLDEYADCLKAVDDDLWRDALVARLTDRDGGAAGRLARQVQTCRADLEARV